MNIIENNQFNIGYICSTLQCLNGNADKIAIISFALNGSVKEYTYKDCDLYSNKIANALSNLGFVEGDVFFTFLVGGHFIRHALS